MARQQILEGTADEIAAGLRRATAAGQRLRVLILPNEEQNRSAPEEQPTPLSIAIARMTSRTPEQVAEAQVRAIETYLPRRPVPAGKTLAELVCGQWPGDETDEQIEAALSELS